MPASDTPGKKKFPSLMALRFVGSLKNGAEKAGEGKHTVPRAFVSYSDARLEQRAQKEAAKAEMKAEMEAAKAAGGKSPTSPSSPPPTGGVWSPSPTRPPVASLANVLKQAGSS